MSEYGQVDAGLAHELTTEVEMVPVELPRITAPQFAG